MYNLFDPYLFDPFRKEPSKEEKEKLDKIYEEFKKLTKEFDFKIIINGKIY